MMFFLFTHLCMSYLWADDETTTTENKTMSSTTIQEKLHISAHLTIKVQKKEAVADMIVQKATDFGGYYASRTEQNLHLKIPSAQAMDFIEFVAGQGLIVERELNSNSLHQEITDLQARLKTREELLNRYFDILNQAQEENVLTVERAVIDLVSEIEGLKGKLRKQEHAAAFADIYVGFQYRERRAPINDGSSSFAWLNSLNIEDIQYSFEYAEDTSRKKATGTIPSNFALYDQKKDIRSASHDGILYRIRMVQPEQDAEIDFWSEAVQNRMYAAGYHPYQAQKTTSSQQEDGNKMIASESINNGVIIRCLAASGDNDLAYWIAFTKKGNSLLLIEVTGEVSTFQSYESNIEAAIQDSFF